MLTLYAAIIFVSYLCWGAHRVRPRVLALGDYLGSNHTLGLTFHTLEGARILSFFILRIYYYCSYRLKLSWWFALIWLKASVQRFAQDFLFWYHRLVFKSIIYTTGALNEKLTLFHLASALFFNNFPFWFDLKQPSLLSLFLLPRGFEALPSLWIGLLKNLKVENLKFFEGNHCVRLDSHSSRSLLNDLIRNWEHPGSQDPQAGTGNQRLTGGQNVEEKGAVVKKTPGKLAWVGGREDKEERAKLSEGYGREKALV